MPLPNWAPKLSVGKFLFVFFQNKVLVCSSGLLGAYNVEQAGLELTESHLPCFCLPSAGTKDVRYYTRQELIFTLTNQYKSSASLVRNLFYEI